MMEPPVPSDGERQPSSAPAVPRVVTDALREPGGPLEPATRSQMESRLGVPLGDVRVHEDSGAPAAVQALAFTAGDHVVLGREAGGLDAPAREQLLVHELTHVL